MAADHYEDVDGWVWSPLEQGVRLNEEGSLVSGAVAAAQAIGVKSAMPFGSTSCFRPISRTI